MSSKGHGRQTFLRGGALIAIGALVAGLSGCAHATDGKDYIPGGCRAKSRTPEVHTFYGTPPELKDKLSQFEKQVDLKLGERTAQMYMVEKGQNARIVLYRRVNESATWSSWEWSGLRSDMKAKEEATKLILETEDNSEKEQGEYCRGARTQRLFETWGLLKLDNTPPHATAEQAFNAFKDVSPGDTYMRLTMFLLC